MKPTKQKEKKNFTFSIGLMEQFKNNCVPKGSNASLEIERLMWEKLEKSQIPAEGIEEIFERIETGHEKFQVGLVSLKDLVKNLVRENDELEERINSLTKQIKSITNNEKA